jgi:hypothetical protein
LHRQQNSKKLKARSAEKKLDRSAQKRFSQWLIARSHSVNRAVRCKN